MSETPAISVVIPVRNRSGQRADNCLRSLRWQDLPEAQVEIILSDFGSEEPFRTATQELAARHDATVIYTATRALWNRSRALNIGLQQARASVVLCTDIDMLFKPDFVRTVLDEVQGSSGGALVVCRCRDLPSTTSEKPWDQADYEQLEAQATFRKAMGTGACQGATKSFFESVRGYDEKYVFWGFEDKDMVSRAQRSGLRLAWVHDKTSMLHQWHRNVARDKLHWKYHNKLRFYLTKHRIKKNRRAWGNR